MAMTLCVMLWARDGQQGALAAYEDQVLALLGDHDCRLVSRVRRTDSADGPYEVQIIEMPDGAALASYMSDPRRTALTEVRDHAIERTEILKVEPV